MVRVLSGGSLIDDTRLEVLEIVKGAMKVAGGMSIYTNTNITVLETA